MTGGNTGIGAEIVRAFSKKGYDAIIHYFEEAPLAKELAKEIKTRSVLVEGDITSEKTRRALLSAVKKTGRLDVLVNNAGINVKKGFFELDENDFMRSFAVNIIAPFRMIQEFCPFLRQTKGSVVNIASIRSEKPRTANVAYCASKAALVNLTKAAAKALAPDVRVNCVSPGPVRTRMQIAGCLLYTSPSPRDS